MLWDGLDHWASAISIFWKSRVHLSHTEPLNAFELPKACFDPPTSGPHDQQILSNLSDWQGGSKMRCCTKILLVVLQYHYVRWLWTLLFPFAWNGNANWYKLSNWYVGQAAQPEKHNFNFDVFATVDHMVLENKGTIGYKLQLAFNRCETELFAATLMSPRICCWCEQVVFWSNV